MIEVQKSGAQKVIARPTKFNPVNAKFDSGRLYQIILAPVVSEKATRISEKSNTVAFKVLQGATKYEVRAAVEMLFKVNVESVAMVNLQGRKKRFGGAQGRRNHIRKAYVTLVKGQEIQLAGDN